MSEFLGSVWWLLVTLGLLVTFHEFGHFWVARRCGVKVLRFSVGFGKPIWSRYGRDGVEYAIGAIPLGGYVKFLDARESDHPETAARQPGEYNAAPVWQRMAIAVAGPVFNIVFAIAAFWGMFVVGRPDFQPVIDAPQGLAKAAGLQAGDRILSVDGERVDSWSTAMLDVAQAAMLRRDTTLEVADARGAQHRRVLALSQLPAQVADNEKTFAAIGLQLQAPPAIVGGLSSDGAATRAGLHVGDRITGINGKSVSSFEDLTRLVPQQAAQNARLHLTVQRGTDTLGFDLDAQPLSENGQTRWIIGVSAAPAQHALEQYGPLRALAAALRETWKTTRSTFQMIGGMLSGAASTRNLSSVISIAQVANASAHMGLAWFLSFLAVISLSLGILNLLPIPLLDGGHIVYYLVEWIKGSPLSERTLIAGQFVGMALLAALMSLAFYNDILRLVTS
jgi:regulator of sigma E protease